MPSHIQKRKKTKVKIVKLVIPAVLASDLREFKEKTEKLGQFSEWLQLDICDGKFAGKETFNDVAAFEKLKGDKKWEVHLMAINPQEIFLNWIKAGASRLVVHLGSAKIEELEKIIKICHENNIEIGIALNPENFVEEIMPLLSKIDSVLLMAVNPGFGGQMFQREVLDKITELRQQWPQGIIEVDGGINKSNIKEISEAGANIFIVGSGILKAKDPAAIFEELTKEIY